MEREVEQNLLAWKNQKRRSPLMLRGARQVGKTFAVDHFAAVHFDHYIKVNFEKQTELIPFFDQLEPAKIVEKLEVAFETPIINGKTLLFLDEIQDCPQAILALRYFKEEMSDLHVIAAGSLLEFALKQHSFRMPVGRVQFLYMKPLSFREYLHAIGKTRLQKELETITPDKPLDETFHQIAMDHVREYLAIGGMPEVVSHYVETKSALQTQEIQTTILETYRRDFPKYATEKQIKWIETVFLRSPGLVGQWLKYTKIDPEAQARELKTALGLLGDAGILHQVFATKGNGIPLAASINPKKFKLLFLDTGLLKRSLGLSLDLLLREDLMLINQGALAEQFVGQELLAYCYPYEFPRIFFWVREHSTSGAEVDYLYQMDSQIIPIEVKAGAIGRLRSLKGFIEEKGSPLGVRIWQGPLEYHQKVLSVPFYLVSELPHLINVCLNRRE
ncbi:MAG: ATP-binding protein [Chlamydiia bacterium]|nr:ATP-binding protein [Chlamydiia bacterium]